MSLKRQTLWSILPLASVTLVNVVSLPLFYRYLGAEMYALWFYVGTLMGAFGFMDLGIGVAVGRYVGVALGRGDADAVRAYWGTGNAIVIPLLGLMAMAFAGIGVWFGPSWFNVSPPNVDLLRWSFVVGGATLFLSYYCQYWLMLSQAHLDFRFLGILRTAGSLVQVVAAIPLAWATRNPLLLIAWAALVAMALLGVFVWHARRSYQIGFSLRHANWARAKEMAVYTSKIFATLLINAFGAADRLLLGRLAPAADFAHFNICANVAGRVQGLSVAAMGPVFSQTNRAVGSGDRTSPAAVYDEVFDFTFPWYLLLSIWVALWHPVVLRLWLGLELAAAVQPLFTPAIIAACFAAITNISTAQLGSLNRVGTGLFFNFAAACFFVLAVVYGWRWGGIVGVAWALLAGRAVGVAQDLFVILLVNAGGWIARTTWKQIGIQTAVGLAFSGSLFFWSRDSVWQLIPATLHGGVVAVFLLRKWLVQGAKT